jgi:hypothetical protein
MKSNSPDGLPPKTDSCLNSSPDACVLCTLVSAAVVRGIRSLFAEFVNDPDSRLRMRSARGFCCEHTRLVAATGDALGISILYADLADQTLQRWNRGASALISGNRPFGRSRIARCPACDVETEADTRYAGALAAGLHSAQVWVSLKEGDCLCMLHVEKVTALSTRENAELLLKTESEKLSKLKTELNEIIRKNDYRFRNEEWGAERDAWLRALNRLVRP